MYRLFILLIITTSCKSEEKHSTRELFHTENEMITELDINRLDTKLVLSIGITLPVVLASNESSIIIYDYGDSMIKILNEKECKIFSSLGTADNVQGGAIFTGIGFSLKSPFTLNVSSESNIRRYDLNEEAFKGDIDEYKDCSSFNKYPSEIFEIAQNSNTLLISQNGIPCINTPRDNKGFNIEEFKSIRFLRITKDDQVNYTFNIPNDNEIIEENSLFVKTFPLISYDKENKYFYGLINPTNQLLKFKIDDKSLEMVVEDEWKIDLNSFKQNIEYTLNKGIDRSLTELNREHNSEITLLKAVKGKIIILYRPSIPIGEANNHKHNHHYYLCIFDTLTENKTTYALDYNKVFFLNCLDNGDMWFYNIEESELSNSVSTVINSININEMSQITSK